MRTWPRKRETSVRGTRSSRTARVPKTDADRRIRKVADMPADHLLFPRLIEHARLIGAHVDKQEAFDRPNILFSRSAARCLVLLHLNLLRPEAARSSLPELLVFSKFDALLESWYTLAPNLAVEASAGVAKRFPSCLSGLLFSHPALLKGDFPSIIPPCIRRRQLLLRELHPRTHGIACDVCRPAEDDDARACCTLRQARCTPPSAPARRGPTCTVQ